MLAADFSAARERIRAHILRTPLETSRTLSRLAGAKLHLKCENLQKTGSFKVRGALNRLLGLSAAERRRGVVAASAGNHAQGIAYAAGIAGVRATVVMPRTAAIAKVEATRGYGAEIVLAGGDYAAAFAHAAALARRRRALLVHAFDDEQVIAGQGTVALEILEQLPEVEVVVVPVGGGGLAAGIASALSTASPAVRVVGAQAELASTLRPSLRAGRRIEAPPSPTIADGLATSGIGVRPWRVLRRHLDRAVTVSEAEIAAAILLLLERSKLVVEGAGAVALAACLGPLRRSIAGRRVAVVLSGGNIDVNVLDRILNLGLAEQGRVFRFATVLIDRPGALAALADVIGRAGANIKQIHHDRGRVGVGVLETLVTVELETRGRDQVPEIVSLLRAAGYRLLR
ncbi:MAG: threonine ammonia-lyase [Deltaproteobacteria bacterium]|nr:threonine ammonia-lyase [Deltaproteobacteria bacterium]